MQIYSLSSTRDSQNVRYIGLTCKMLKTRLTEHISESRYLRTFKDRWIQKQLREGYTININLLEISYSIEDLKRLEIFYIKVYRDKGYSLVNLTDGGDGAFGYKRSEESKALNSAKKSKEIYLFDYKTHNLINKYNSIKQMCELVGLTRNAVNDTMNGKVYQHKGYIFGFSDTPIVHNKRERHSWNKGISSKGKQRFKITPIKMIKGEDILEFKLMTDAASYFDVSHSLLSRHLKNATKFRGYTIIKSI